MHTHNGEQDKGQMLLGADEVSSGLCIDLHEKAHAAGSRMQIREDKRVYGQTVC